MLLSNFYISIILFYFFYNLLVAKFIHLLILLSPNEGFNNLNFFFNLTSNSSIYFTILLLLNISGIPPFVGFFFNIQLFTWFNGLNFISLLLLLFGYYFTSLFFYLNNINYLFLDDFVSFNKTSSIFNVYTTSYFFTSNSLIFLIFSLGLFFLDDFYLLSLFLSI